MGHSKLLIYYINAHCHLPTRRAFLDFTAHCNKNGYVARYLTVSAPPPPQHIHEFGWIYSRIPKMMYSPHLQTSVYFNSNIKSVIRDRRPPIYSLLKHSFFTCNMELRQYANPQ